MSKVVSLLSDVTGSLIDFAVDVVVFVAWEAPWYLVEVGMSILGIKDEEFVIVQKLSSLLYDFTNTDLVKDANVKAVMSMIRSGSSFYNWRQVYINNTKNNISLFYKFGKSGGYVNKLPSVEITAGVVDNTVIDLALTVSTGLTATRLSMNTSTPNDEIYFKELLQNSPYYYKPWNNTLTYTDPYGVVRTDYKISTITFNILKNRNEIAIYRISSHALVWIEGPSSIVEGGSATYTVKCNRNVPSGKSITVSFIYGGTALSRRYIAIPSVTIPAGASSAVFTVNTDNNILTDGNSTISVIISSIINTTGAFESVGIHPVDTVTTTVIDNDSKILTFSSTTVIESSGSIVIPVKLEKAAAAAFSVTYSTIDGLATGGVDYDNSGGTLNFTGTAGEIQSITITIIPDIVDDNNEDFLIRFSSTTDSTIDITQTCKVVITDNTGVFSTPGNISITGLITKPPYIKEKSIVTTYHETSKPSTEWFYWIYKFSSQTYPELKNSAQVITDLEMLPIIILKNSTGAINDDKLNTDYKSARRMLSILGLNIDSIITGLKTDTNYNLITNAYLNFSIATQDTSELVSKGLWLSFYELIVIIGLTSSKDEYVSKVTEQGVNNAMTWTRQTYVNNVVAVIPNLKTHNHTITSIPEVLDSDGNSVTRATTKLTLEHKLSATTLERIEITGLSSLSTIRTGDFSDIAISSPVDTNFTIPVSYYVISKFSAIDIMKFYGRIIRIDTYAANIIELAWYETSAFAFLFKSVSIFITVITLSGATGPLEVLKQVLYQYTVQELVKIIAVQTGNAEFAALIGLIATLSSPFSTSADIDFSSAEDLLKVSTEFANNLTAGYDSLTQETLDDINEINKIGVDRLKEISNATPNKSPITAEFLVALNSVDTGVFPAIKAQYNFDLVFDYDRLVSSYFDLNLRIGVT